MLKKMKEERRRRRRRRRRKEKWRGDFACYESIQNCR